MPEPLRIVIVDDSRVFRGAIEDALAGRADLRIAGSVWSGEKALELIRTAPPDLVTLDIEMPGMGGLATLKAIREWNAAHPQIPAIGVLLVSSYTRSGAAVTIEGLQAGAFDFVTKPADPNAATNEATLRQELITKIDAFIRHRAQWQANQQLRQRPEFSLPDPFSTQNPVAVQRANRAIRAIAIGTSTGGPAALVKLLPALTSMTSLPLFVVQHMPVGFTEPFAANLARICNRVVYEVQGELAVQPNTVYLAAGGRHMVVRAEDSRVIVNANDQPAENGCRPSFDVFLRSAAVAYPLGILAIVLTGMGSDGAKGLASIKRAKGTVLAQDEASSVVWGMPRAAIEGGFVDQVVSLERMHDAVAQVLGSAARPQDGGCP